MSVPECSDSTEHDVSPDLIVVITQIVKKELMEHFEQTGTPVDSQPEATPLQCNYSSTRSSSTPSPLPTGRKVYTPPSPAQPTKLTHPPEPTFSPLELSTIDKKWGTLFDSNGSPTTRLGKFLLGLANHMIVEFNPKRSILVTLVKMYTYYSNCMFNWQEFEMLNTNLTTTIFKAQSYAQISRLYHDLDCQYYLVPEGGEWAPALTPVGFARWMSLHIMAYPDQEAKRLEKAVLDLPIDADGLTEGKVERLPKQISRHLLPEKEDRGPKTLIETVVANFFEDIG
ncbi:hypothetical protein B0O99DRAFT_698601, partial [Bisporella sp. PMI_857]